MNDQKMKAMHLDYDQKSKIMDLAKPIPEKGEVLVQVKFAALDTATPEVLNKHSWTASFIHAKSEPLILGWHYSGTIVQVGEDVNEYQVGNAVWGHLQYEPSQKQGSFSEYITVTADACALQPDNVSLEQCAAASTEGLTALQAMRDYGGLKEDMHVLIVGAGGGVGSAAVGIAKKLGATRITATCSSRDVARVQSLGADRVLNKSQDPFAGDNQKYHVIFDTPNIFSSRDALSHLYPGGAYVCTLPSWSWLGGYFVSLFSSKTVAMVSVKSKKEDLELVGRWIQKDLSKCFKIDSQFNIKDIKDALARQNDRAKVGRVVVKVQDGWS